MNPYYIPYFFYNVDIFFELISKSKLSNDYFEFINQNHHKILALICPVAEEFFKQLPWKCYQIKVEAGIDKKMVNSKVRLWMGQEQDS